MTEAREHATSAARRVRRRGDVSILTPTFSSLFGPFFHRVIHRVIKIRVIFDREWFNFGFKKRHISKAKTPHPLLSFPDQLENIPLADDAGLACFKRVRIWRIRPRSEEVLPSPEMSALTPSQPWPL